MMYPSSKLIVAVVFSLAFTSSAVSERAVRHGKLRVFRAVENPSQSKVSLPATQYYGTVSIGEPPQWFNVLFDTLSEHLILPDDVCDEVACALHRRFVANKSITAMQIGWADEPTKALKEGDDRDTRSLSILGSDVAGHFVRDKLCVGGHQNSAHADSNVSKGIFCAMIDFITLTEEIAQPFGPLKFDGIIGLAPQTVEAGEFNVLRTILMQHSKLFALYLSSTHGEFSFGGYRRPRMASNLTWVPLSNNMRWEVAVDDIMIGGQPQSFCALSGCKAVVDTGSSFVMLPGNILVQLIKGLDDKCSSYLPSLGFIIKGHRFELSSTDYLERDADRCGFLLSLASTAQGSTFVLGYPFLRKFYTVFDQTHHQIGFALADHSSETQLVEDTSEEIAVVPLVGGRP